MKTSLAALAAGLLLGAGLAISDMINPARVLAFLDVAGAFDPTLAFVMAGAVLASAIGYAVSRRRKAPLFGARFFIPENRQLDRQLIGGAALFGIGWGLAGYCPGPAVAGLAFGMWQAWLFVAAMLAGMMLHRLAAAPRQRKSQSRPDGREAA
ncbi:MAG TPA: YeeE/YedE family protein [Sphingomicrobium sp.]